MGSQLAGDVSRMPGGSLPLLSPGAYLPSFRASPPFHWLQILFLGDIGTCVWVACLGPYSVRLEPATSPIISSTSYHLAMEPQVATRLHTVASGRVLLTWLADGSGKAWCTVTHAGDVVARRIVKAVTHVRAIDAVVSVGACVLTEGANPPGATVTLPGHQVTIGLVLALARLVAVRPVQSLLALCQQNVK